MKGTRRVLFIYKKSAYQIHVRERKNGRVRELIDRADPAVQNVLSADADHVETLEEAREAVKAMGVKGVFRYRSDEGLVEGFDLIVTIGGDGTLLWASHRVPPGVAVLAINSAPLHSVGHFCGGRKGRVRQALEAAIEGRLKASRLTRMQVELDGEVLNRRVLNDALYCHKSPAATTRYILSHEGVEEPQKSSGLWIGPAAGSTAAMRSAGGKILPPASRKIQYVVREPYHPPEGSYRRRRGLVKEGDALVLRSQIREGRLYLDGPRIVHEVDLGQVLRFSRSDEPLTLLAFPRASDR
ncbi:MAG: NAD(+)/NADH kinase [Sandaracinaceae bacterium]|nr:NAD(+)/NADH kinase [Sandaracinaceae bacterium]